MRAKNGVFLFPFLLVAYEMVIYLSNDMYLPALPTIANDFATSHYAAQWTLTAWFLGASAFQLIVGPLADRYGRRSVLLCGGVLYILSSIICAVTTNLILFTLVRFIQGSAVCSAVVAGYATIYELYDYRRAVKIMAIMGSVIVLAPALGPLMGSMVLVWGDWRMIFWILAGIAIIAISSLAIYMPETLTGEKQHELEIKKQLRCYWTILTNRRFFLKTFLFSILFMAVIAWIAIGPFLVIDDFNQTPLQFGIYQVIIFSAFIIGTNCIRLFIEHRTLLWIVCLGTSIAVVGGIASIVFVLLFPDSILSLVLTLAMFAGGSGLCFSPLTRMAIESSDQPMGSIMAMFSSMMSLFGMLSTLIIGLIYTHTTLPVAIMMCVISFVAIGILYLIYTDEGMGKLDNQQVF